MKILPLILALLIGCASHTRATWESKLDVLDGKSIEMSGTPVFSEIDPSFLYLCPPGHSGPADARCIDVVASTKVVAKLRGAKTDCATVFGGFSAFGKNRVGAGYLRSDIGIIDATRATPCAERQLFIQADAFGAA